MTEIPIFGLDTGDLLGVFNPRNGVLVDIMGRSATNVANIDAAKEQMRTWSWVV